VLAKAGSKFRQGQRNAELPLLISDHCNWPELLQTFTAVNPYYVRMIHCREDAFMYQPQKGVALSLVGYDEAAQEE
jgi:putative mRNA 3-end processing factor